MTGIAQPEVAPAEVIESALAQRLRAACGVLLDEPPPAPDPDVARDAGILLDLLVEAVRARPSPDRVWLLYVAVSGSYPAADALLEAIRQFQLIPVVEMTLWLLDRALDNADRESSAHGMHIVADQVVVDVDHSARHDLHTGIQQVVRRTVPLWMREHNALPVAWSDRRRALRTLSAAETRRVHRDAPRQDAPTATIVVVPWHTTVVLAETPPQESCARLAALAQWSGNTVVAVGYDCIPAVSGDLVPLAEPARFGRYLTVIKHARRVAAISESAAAEFQGFADALPAQGLRGPTVVECALPVEASAVSDDRAQSAARPDVPLILSVGSLEPRKNHLAILYAAERLWREGLRFELLFIGGSGWGDEVPREVARLRARGRSVSTRRAVSDAELAAAYRDARFTVFPSLHEGYGLPVAESVSLGTPVITSDYGSTKEIAAGGGAVLVDPRDDDAILDAMRSLLTDDARLQALRDAIARRPVRTWQMYAAELWDCLVTPEPGATSSATAP